MKLLVLQETDWIKRGPHQQHHLMDRMALSPLISEKEGWTISFSCAGDANKNR